MRGAGEVGLAITMSTLTTIVVFLPVSLVDGPGQFFLLRLAIPVCVSREPLPCWSPWSSSRWLRLPDPVGRDEAERGPRPGPGPVAPTIRLRQGLGILRQPPTSATFLAA